MTAGYSPDAIFRRLAAGKWELLHADVYRPAEFPSSHQQRVRAAQLWGGQESAVSHRTAAGLWGFFENRAGMVEITTTAKLRSGRGVIVHHRSYLPTCDVTCREGVQVTTPERTLLDLAAVVPIRALEHAVDSALRQELATLEKLRARLAVLGHSGRNGTTNMRMVLGDRPDGYRATDSPLEDAFMEVVDRHGLPVPVRQRHIQRHGVSIGRFDFLYLEGRIVIELDGYGHHWDRRSFQRDRRRSNELGLEGWLVLRYTWQDVTRRGDVVAAEVRAALAARSKD